VEWGGGYDMGEVLDVPELSHHAKNWVVAVLLTVFFFFSWCVSVLVAASAAAAAQLVCMVLHFPLVMHEASGSSRPIAKLPEVCLE